VSPLRLHGRHPSLDQPRGQGPVFLINPPHTGTRALECQGLAFLWPGTRVSTNPRRAHFPARRPVLVPLLCTYRRFCAVAITALAEFCTHTWTCMHVPGGRARVFSYPTCGHVHAHVSAESHLVLSCHYREPHAPAHEYPSSRRTQG
jgi:hypothetical protein